MKYAKLAALLTLGLGLSACSSPAGQPNNQGAAPVNQPAHSTKSFGLYQLQLQANTAGELTGTVSALSNQMSAQASELSGLSFAATAAQVTTDASGNKTYTMPLTITNNSSASISKLHLVPVSISSNQNSTYFHSAKNSSGATSNPTGLTLAAGAGTAWLNMIQPAKLRGFDFTLPNGVTFIKYNDKAWASSSSIANGANSNLSLKFNIPSSNSTYRFSVVFGAFDIPTVSNNLIISSVYGGGGNSGATYTHDYVELLNPTNRDISLDGLSLQYASSTGSFNNTMALPNIVVPAGKFFLVQMKKGNGGTTALPTPDATGNFAMSSTKGKVALVKGTTALGAINGDVSAVYHTSDSKIIDLVGYGSANAFETSAAPATNNTTAAIRSQNNCADTDDNSSDFSAIAATPRNSSTSQNDPSGCPATTSSQTSVE